MGGGGEGPVYTGGLCVPDTSSVLHTPPPFQEGRAICPILQTGKLRLREAGPLV